MITPRPYQKEGFDAVLKYFENCKGNPIVAWPTGTGKSLLIGMLIAHTSRFVDQRVLVLTHVKELISQNFETAKEVYPFMPAGIYSAGLGVKDSSNPITFAGIASVYKKAAMFGRIDLVLIDECHLVSEVDDSMYLTFLNELKKINPIMKIVGFSATPFRMKDGELTQGKIFTDVCHDLTSMKSFNKLIKDGYLSPVVPHCTDFALDVSGVGLRGDEFIPSQLQAAVDIETVTQQAVHEMCVKGKDRKHWLVFGSGISHAESITRWLIAYGISAVCIHSKMPTEHRDARIEAFKQGKVRAAVNNMVLTTGSNIPFIDLIADLQPTMSAARHVQKYGRGTRPFEGKENCLGLDFARNTENLGPINNVWMPERIKGKPRKPGSAPVKVCPECNNYVSAMARKCEHCGYDFPKKVKFFGTASTADIIEKEEIKVELFDVTSVAYKIHRKSTPSMRVTYLCGLRRFSEWVCFEHKNFARKKAVDWHSERSFEEVPATVEQALGVAYKEPKQIRVWINKKYPEILGFVF